ncbi:MAG TPA: hypothetical protein VK583_13630, partial [Burkholderiales bacterium]|nr:hypothetical protein [Burkholderiales bacterium]
LGRHGPLHAGRRFLQMGDGYAAIAVRSLGTATALVLGFFGTLWGAQAALAAIAALAIAVLLIERRLESRKT